MKDSSLITFEKIHKKDNTKVMLDFTKVASTEDGIEIFQSINKNVITIIKDDFYYHITLNDILDAVFMGEER